MHDENDDRRGCNGRDRVHGDAELTMIGIALAGVQVHDLSDGEGGQQDEAQYRYCREKSGAGAAFAAENCAKSCQLMKPSSSILQKPLQSLDAFGQVRLHGSYDSEVRRGKSPGMRDKTGIGRDKTASGRERLN